MRARGHRGGFPNSNLLPCRAGRVLSPLSKVRHDTVRSRSARHAPRQGNACRAAAAAGDDGELFRLCDEHDDTAERASLKGRRGDRVVSGATASSDNPFSVERR